MKWATKQIILTAKHISVYDNILSTTRHMRHSELFRVLSNLIFDMYDLIVLWHSVETGKYFVLLFTLLCSIFDYDERYRSVIKRRTFPFQNQTPLPVSGLLTFCAYLSSFLSYSRKLNLAAIEAPHGGENNSVRKLDPIGNLLTLFPICNRFRDIRVFHPLLACLTSWDVTDRKIRHQCNAMFKTSLLSYENIQILTSRKILTTPPIDRKLCTADKIGKISEWAQLCWNLVRWMLLSTIGTYVKILFCDYVCCFFLITSIGRTAEPIFTLDGSNDAIWPRKCLLRVSSIEKFLQKISLSQKPKWNIA